MMVVFHNHLGHFRDYWREIASQRKPWALTLADSHGTCQSVVHGGICISCWVKHLFGVPSVSLQGMRIGRSRGATASERDLKEANYKEVKAPRFSEAVPQDLSFSAAAESLGEPKRFGP